MAVPNTNTFSLSDVITEVGAATPDLAACFAAAMPGRFDTDYANDKNDLLEFRNYGAAPVWYNNSNWNISQITNNVRSRIIMLSQKGLYRGKGLHFSNNGTKCIAIFSNSFHIMFVQCFLTTPWDVSTLSITPSLTQTVSVELTTPTQQSTISKDGTKIYIPTYQINAVLGMTTCTLTSDAQLPLTGTSTVQVTVPTGKMEHRITLLESKFSNTLYARMQNLNTTNSFIYYSNTRTDFNSLTTGFNNFNVQSTGRVSLPFFTIGKDDEYIVEYENTANNTDVIKQYRKTGNTLSYIATRNYGSIIPGDPSDYYAIAVPTLSKLYSMNVNNPSDSENITFTIIENDTNF